MTLPIAPINQAVNQAPFQVNPVQRYVANQPYFNRFTGKGLMSQSINRQTLTLAPSSTPQIATLPTAAPKWSITSDNYFMTKEQKGKLLSTVKNIPIFKSYKGTGVNGLAISRFNSYLLYNKLFPNALHKNNNEGGSAFYSKSLTQNRILTNPLSSPSHKERLHSSTLYRVEPGTARNKFRSALQGTGSLAHNRGSYKHQSLITTFLPLVNNYLKDSNYFDDGITHNIGNLDTGQALPYSSYLRPQESSVPNNSSQTIPEAFSTPVSTRLANEATFRSPLSNGFYSRPPLSGRGSKIHSAEDKVVTEGELREKGLLSDIFSRDHIRHKPDKEGKDKFRKNKT